MHFDVNRLSQLAGLSSDSRQRLNEAGNRSQREDPGEPDDVDHRWGKNQISERQGPAGEEEDNLVQYERQKYGGNKRDKSATDPGDEDFTWRESEEDPIGELDNVEFLGEQGEEDVEEDIVLEIDEGMLRQEILKMRSKRLQEQKLRTAIRNEIQGIFKDLGLGHDTSWIYGDNPPTNSLVGQIATGFKGIGFK